ncbi:MAG: MFS transporter [Bryobacteraceae bacterium]
MTRQQWPIAILLFLSTVINYIDRQTLSVVAPVLTKELGISDLTYSRILTAFLVAYTMMYVGSGFLVDRFGTRRSLAGFMGWWSVANMMHAAVGGAWSLAGFRMLLGLGESGNFMAAFKAISEWYEPKHRAFVNGLVQAGASVGGILAPPVITAILVRWGWRPAFVATGALGFVWIFAWMAAYRHAPATVDVKARTASRWREMLSYRQTWGLFLARFFSDPVWWFYLFWLPKYLVDQRGFTVAEMGMLAWMPYLSADIGALVGGALSDRLVRRGWDVLRARRAGMLPFAMLMPLSLVIAYTPSRGLALGLICVVTFAHMAWKTNVTTLTNDIYPVEVVGSVAGIVAFGNGLGGTLFTAAVGMIITYAGYETIFAIMGCLHPFAYLLLTRLVREPVAADSRMASVDRAADSQR